MDDKEEFISALAERLIMSGIPTLASSGGEEAQKMIATCPPHVVLPDMMTPGLGGTEIPARIRLTHPEISVIFLTGHGGIELGPECNDYLIKPVNIAELIRKVRSISRN